ncbi:hypothetical protein ACFLRW_07150 [Acidobacteriota bacterium]
MIKKSLPLFWIFLLICPMLAAQQGDDLINGIFLIKNPNETFSSPPRQIRIGIDMAAQAYFKLSNEETILSVGILPKGVNSLQIPTDTFFEKTAKFTLHLELKRGILIIKKDIILDVQMAVMETPIEVEVEPEPIITEYKLSLYIEDQLVSTRIKQKKFIPSFQKELAPIAGNTDPFYVPKESDNLMRNTVSILDAIGLAYGLIKSAVKKKKRDVPEPTLQHTHSLTLKFSKMNAQGIREEVIAMIGLTTK